VRSVVVVGLGVSVVDWVGWATPGPPCVSRRSGVAILLQMGRPCAASGKPARSSGHIVEKIRCSAAEHDH